MSRQHDVMWRDQSVFINESQYIGRVASAEATLTRQTTTVGGLGGVGQMQVPNGKFEASTATVNFQSVAPSDLLAMVGNDGWVELRMSGNVRILDASSGTRKLDSVQTRIKGWCLNPPVPGMNDQGAPYSANISVAVLEISNNAGTIFKVDFINGIVEPSQDTASLSIGITIPL